MLGCECKSISTEYPFFRAKKIISHWVNSSIGIFTPHPDTFRIFLTHRTKLISSSVRIDTFRDAEKDNFRKLFDSSPGQGVIDDKQQIRTLSASQYPHWGNSDALKRAILVSNLDLNLMFTTACPF